MRYYACNARGSLLYHEYTEQVAFCSLTWPYDRSRIDKSSEVNQADPVDPALKKAILKVRIHTPHLASCAIDTNFYPSHFERDMFEMTDRGFAHVYMIDVEILFINLSPHSICFIQY